MEFPELVDEVGTVMPKSVEPRAVEEVNAGALACTEPLCLPSMLCFSESSAYHWLPGYQLEAPSFGSFGSSVVFVCAFCLPFSLPSPRCSQVWNEDLSCTNRILSVCSLLFPTQSHVTHVGDINNWKRSPYVT